MNCRTCGYGLWNLRARECPECGAGFRPSDFEFTPNAVRYRCPHCRQEYYGTDARGHLVPREFGCVSCGARIDMDECVLEPAEGVREERAAAERNPWARPREGEPLRKRFFGTIGLALAQPHRLGRATPEGASVGRALGFALIVAGIGGAVNAGLGALLVGSMMMVGAAGSGGGVGTPAALLAGVAPFLVMGLGSAVVVVLAAIGCALAAHLILKATGGAPRPLRSTVNAVLYAGGANIVSAVPCFGFYIGVPWWIVSATIGLVHAQGVRAWRGVLAMVLPPVLVFVALCVGYVALMTAVISTASGARGGWSTPADARTLANGAYAALVATVDARRAAGEANPAPGHGLLLVPDGGLSAAMGFTEPSSGTAWPLVPAGPSSTLMEFSTRPAWKQRQTAESAAAALPAGVVAHRVGDLVFTWHGIDFSNGVPAAGDAGRLWVVLASQDPGTHGDGFFFSSTSGSFVVAVDRSGNAETIGGAAWPARLAEQNRLRAAEGLPPLPDPGNVTHANPAVGP